MSFFLVAYNQILCWAASNQIKFENLENTVTWSSMDPNKESCREGNPSKDRPSPTSNKSTRRWPNSAVCAEGSKITVYVVTMMQCMWGHPHSPLRTWLWKNKSHSWELRRPFNFQFLLLQNNNRILLSLST